MKSPKCPTADEDEDVQDKEGSCDGPDDKCQVAENGDNRRLHSTANGN